MAIQINDMVVNHISEKCIYEIQYGEHVFEVDRPLFHKIYDKHSTSQAYRILKEMFKDDKFLKGSKKVKMLNITNKEEVSFWLDLINNDLKKQIPSPPKPPEPPKTRVVGGTRRGGFCLE
ncbi:hypothetical protein XbC2_188 [Xanthomonas phage XbC2]|nr:hypothetical protein XbC2_188 [Xanthomonas phage XbC2]